GSEGGDHLVLESIGEISGIKEGKGYWAERVALFGLFDALSGKRRPCHAGVEHRMSVLFEPWLEHRDLSRASDAIGPFDDDEAAPQFLQFDAADSFAVEFKAVVFRWWAQGAQSSSQPLPLGRLGTSRNSRSTSPRTSYCCSSMGRVASITVRPNSSTMLSYWS